MIDASPRPLSSGRPSDAGLHQNLTRLDITAANAPAEMQWQATQGQPVPQQGFVNHQPATVAPHQVQSHPASMPEPPVTPRRNKRQAWYGGPVQASPSSRPGVGTHRPSPEDSGSSDGVPTPGTSQGTEYHPVIYNGNGAENFTHAPVMSEEQKVYFTTERKPEPARADSGYQTYNGNPPQPYTLNAGHDPRFAANYSQTSNNEDMSRLAALVSVATSENRAIERS